MECDLKSILLALCQNPCPHSFDCLPHYYYADGDRYLILCVKNGKGKSKYTVDKPNEEEEEKMEYDEQDEVINEKPNSEADEETKALMVNISKHISLTITRIFDANVVDIKLYFGKKEDTLYLLDNSICVYSDRYSHADQFLADFNNFYIDQLSKVYDPAICCSDEPDCGVPAYAIPRSTFILHKAILSFPDADKALILKMIKMRTQADPNIHTCIRCSSLFDASKLKAIKAKTPLPTINALPPAPFQPLVSSELHLKQKFQIPVGLNPNMNKPYSFAINYYESPYRAPPMNIKKPSQGKYETPQPLKKKNPSVVNRLDQVTSYQQRTGTFQNRSQSSLSKREPLVITPRYEPRKSYSEKLAPKLYGKPPYIYKNIDKKRCIRKSWK